MSDELSKSQIIFGTASIAGDHGGYSFGSISESEAIELINLAYDKKIKTFDTAPIYGFGSAEKRLGLAIKDKRENIELISKAGVDWHPSKRVNMSNEPRIITKMLHESLRRLDTDYIDIYMIHWPDKNIDIRLALDVVTNAQKQGLIKKIGLSNTTNEDLKLAREVCHIDYIQCECNLFNNPVTALNTENSLTQGWGSLDKGILAGSVTLERQFQKSDCRSWAPWWKKSDWKKKVVAVHKLQEKFGYSPIELAVAFSKNNVNMPIYGFKTAAQLNKIQSLYNQEININVLNQVSEYLRNEIG